MTVQATVAVRNRQAPYAAVKPNFYRDLLNDAKQMQVILQDTGKRRAWQTNVERVILHIILDLQAKGEFGENVKLTKADVKDPESVRKAMEENRSRELHQDQHIENRKITGKLFIDLVRELWEKFELLHANLADVAATDTKLRVDCQKRIYGYEYKELLERRNFELKEAFLKKTCGLWPDYARDINAVVLFGTNFGEIIRPTSTTDLCDQYSILPAGKDYIVIEVPFLAQLYTKNAFEDNQRQLTSSGKLWHRSKHMFEPCPPTEASTHGPSHCMCERIQEFFQKGAKVGPIRYPGELGSCGAVIFGHNPRTLRWSHRVRSSVGILLHDKLRRRNEADNPVQGTHGTHITNLSTRHSSTVVMDSDLMTLATLESRNGETKLISNSSTAVNPSKNPHMAMERVSHAPRPTHSQLPTRLSYRDVVVSNLNSPLVHTSLYRNSRIGAYAESSFETYPLNRNSLSAQETSTAEHILSREEYPNIQKSRFSSSQKSSSGQAHLCTPSAPKLISNTSQSHHLRRTRPFGAIRDGI